MIDEIVLPDPPTGPLAQPYTPADGRPARYVKFITSDEGRVFWNALVHAALQAKGRFSTRTFVAMYRDQEKVRINDHFTVWLADDLLRHYPILSSIIERRVRRVTPGMEAERNAALVQVIAAYEREPWICSPSGACVDRLSKPECTLCLLKAFLTGLSQPVPGFVQEFLDRCDK